MKENNQKSTLGGFIDGKKQIIDMLKMMSPQEKVRLLKNVKNRNPIMAHELMKEGISFEQLSIIGKDKLQIILSHINPAIMGMALKSSSPQTQRYILKESPREYALEAYKIMTTPIEGASSKSDMAKEKILKLATDIFGKQIFNMLS
ncbi:MAG: hypothetical protein HQK49_10535 [Oligoflexia bacterium]|nr:hypothetical protein [Oligoflexia bacterium]